MSTSSAIANIERAVTSIYKEGRQITPFIKLEQIMQFEEIVEYEKRLNRIITTNQDLEKIPNLQGVMIVKIFPEEDIKLTSNYNDLITNIDQLKFLEWIHTMNTEYYIHDFYRIDLSNIIFLFQNYFFNSNILLIGNVLVNNKQNKIELMTIKQKYLLNMVKQ